MKLEKGHRYLAKNVSHAPSFSQMYEFHVLEVSKKAYKIHDLLNDKVRWIAKEDFDHDDLWGPRGYCVIEDLGLFGKANKQLMKNK